MMKFSRLRVLEMILFIFNFTIRDALYCSDDIGRSYLNTDARSIEKWKWDLRSIFNNRTRQRYNFKEKTIKGNHHNNLLGQGLLDMPQSFLFPSKTKQSVSLLTSVHFFSSVQNIWFLICPYPLCSVFFHYCLSPFNLSLAKAQEKDLKGAIIKIIAVLTKGMNKSPNNPWKQKQTIGGNKWIP